MGSKTKANIFKHLICASIGILLLSFTSIFVIRGIYQGGLDDLIDKATILKDNQYPTWGQFPGTVQADYTHTLTFFNLSLNGSSTPLEPVTFDYSFSYNNMSFGQGDQGTIKYLNQWNRNWRQGQEQLKKQKVKTINLAAEKIYNYEYSSTETRKFVLGFNSMWKAIKDMLPQYYGLYLNEFYLKDEDTIQKTIFDIMNIKEQSRKLILNDQKYGWYSNTTNLASWFRLAHLPNEVRINHPDFQLIRQTCQLSSDELLNLVGEKSIIYKLSQALNGTIKNKVEANGLDYEDCVPFCSDDQLISIQLSTGFLTNVNLMGKLNLNSLFNDLNTSYPFPVEYSKFCSDNPDYTCIDKKNTILTFEKQFYNNFTFIGKLEQHKDNYELVQNLFKVENPYDDGSYGKSLIAYMDYLSSQIFNSFDEDKEQIYEDSYKHMFPNFQYLVQHLNYLQDILQQQVISKGLINHIQKQKITCSQFFTGSFAGYSELCKQKQTDLTQTEAMRTYVKAYFFDGREHFKNMTSMNSETSANFLRFNQKDSLFAQIIRTIQEEIATSAQCKQSVCSSKQLLARQWGGNKPILSNLPQNFFPGGSLDIFDLDIEGRLNKVDPRYWKIMGQKLQDQTAFKLISNEESSIFVLLNLMKYMLKARKGDADSKKIIQYVQKVVIDSYFTDYLQTNSIEQVIGGYQAKSIEIKRNAQPLKGGAPWLSNKVNFIQINHHPQDFNKLNTGIYNKDSLRELIQVEEQTNVSSTFKVFTSDYQNVEQKIYSDKQIYGTNMLGFRQDISNSDSLSVYLDFINSGTVLTNIDADYQYKGKLSTFKYQLQSRGQKISIGTEEQNQRYIVIDSSSYVAVEPITGITLEMNIKYTTYSTISSYSIYSGEDSVKDFKLFDMEVRYERENLDSINQISDARDQKYKLNLIMIVVASFSMVLTIIFSALYLHSKKKQSSNLIQSLIDGQAQVV